ncbi:MAG: hypothetical protein U1F43_17750 [Myxococcota bacterium]
MLTGAVYLPGRAWSSRLAGCVAALALGLGAAGGARADEPAPAPHVVRLDLARGPLITSSRITGLGGAYAGVAVGIDGVWRNPATLANRPDYSTDWFDYDLTLDWLIIAADEVDFDGDGLQAGSASRELVAVNVGFSLQFGPLALGFLATTYGYSATSDAAETVDVQFIDFLMGVAWAGDDGQWIGGGGVLVSVLNAQAPFFGSDAIALTGSALDAGFLYRPRERPWRVGAHLRFGAELGLDGDAAPATLPPSISAVEAAIPWQIGLGASYMMAADPARQYNPRLRSTIAPVLDHRYLLLSAETVVYGATGGESLEALVSGVERALGRAPERVAPPRRRGRGLRRPRARPPRHLLRAEPRRGRPGRPPAPDRRHRDPPVPGDLDVEGHLRLRSGARLGERLDRRRLLEVGPRRPPASSCRPGRRRA